MVSENCEIFFINLIDTHKSVCQISLCLFACMCVFVYIYYCMSVDVYMYARMYAM